MTHNKYLTFLFLEDNDSISAKSAPQDFSLVSDLCNYSANCSFTLAPDPV